MHRKDRFPHNEAIIDNNIMAMESYIFFVWLCINN